MARRSKYRAVPTFVDGIRFASKREARRYGELKLLEKAGKISELTLQRPFPCYVNDTLVCTYIADFCYLEGGRAATFPSIIEDCKGFRTPIYRLKKKLVEACYGFEIRET